MTQNHTHYCSPKLTVAPLPAKGGQGILAAAPIQSGEVLLVWGGQVLTLLELEAQPDDIRRHSIQVEEHLFLAIPPGAEIEPADMINHSCDPNAGLLGQITVVALRDIQPGEEVCFDYAMSDSDPYDQFDCCCGSPFCRGRVTGEDWRRPELWERYGGHFSPYLQRRIEREKADKKV